jgi:MFS family permease
MLPHLRSQLARFFSLSAQADVHPQIAQHFRRNFIVNAVDMMVWLFGTSFISVSAILPVYASRLTESPILIGLIPAFVDAGWFLPQLFLAPFVEKMPRKYPAVMVLGAVERLPFVVMPFVVWWIGAAQVASEVAIAIFLALIAVRAISSGIVAAPWQELMAKVIPVTHRGRFFGVAHFAGQLLGVGGAGLATYLLAALPYPQNFVWCFAVGAVFIVVSYVFTALTKEPALPPPPHAHAAALDRDYARRLLAILRQNVNFRNYLISRWFSYAGGMAAGFLAVYAVEHFQLDDSVAAIFTGILYAAGVAGYATWGPIGDRLGHKRVMEFAALLWLLALGTALLAPAAWGFYLVFALVGFSSSAGVLSDINLAMEFGPEAERPTYIGLTRTFTGPALLIAPVAGGWLAQTWSYPTLFAVSLALALIGGALLKWQVREPRAMQKAEGSKQ